MRTWKRLRAMLQTESWLREQATLWASYHFPEPQQEVAAMVARILVKNLAITFDILKPASRFVEDLAMDDSEPAELVMALEEELKFELPDEELKYLCTVADLVNYLHVKIRARSSVPLVKVL